MFNVLMYETRLADADALRGLVETRAFLGGLAVPLRQQSVLSSTRHTRGGLTRDDIVATFELSIGAPCGERNFPCEQRCLEISRLDRVTKITQDALNFAGALASLLSVCLAIGSLGEQVEAIDRCRLSRPLFPHLHSPCVLSRLLSETLWRAEGRGNAH